MSDKTIHPEILWAQRSSDSDEEKNVLFITINLPDVIENSLELDLTAEGINFKARSGNAAKGLQEKNYSFNLTFFAPIKPDHPRTTKKLTSRSLVMTLVKADLNTEYWPRLSKDKKVAFIKTDFSKWVDEDEQDGEVPEKEEDDMGGMPGMPGMGGMGGMGGMPGMEGLGGMGGMGGGMPGMGGMDIQQMLASMGGGAGGPGGPGGPSDLGDAAEEDDSDDDGPPPLEDAPAPSS